MVNKVEVIPKLYRNKENCCGCTACYSKCPAKAINMLFDEEGFLYPVINEEKCIKCNLCVTVCKYKKDQHKKNIVEEFKGKVYAVKHKDESVRKQSRSGGVFTAISDEILKQGGCVYGCIMKNNFEAIHTKAETSNERNQMRGSKYIQSNKKEVYCDILFDLERGSKVLFSGTSCEVAGLKSFLGKEYDNLLCVDIVCHGVPSPLVWKCYVEWQEKKNRNKVKNVEFRNKKDFGWAEHVETFILENNRKVHGQVFRNLFLKDLILRPCCYKCPYKSIEHPGDITIADYWGIERAVPGFDDNRGTSLVLVNNEKGEKYFEVAQKRLCGTETNIKSCIQPALQNASPLPKEREEFWRDFRVEAFDDIARKYGNKSWKSSIKILILWVKNMYNTIRS